MHLRNPLSFTERGPHAVAPIGVGYILLDRFDAGPSLPSRVDAFWRWHNSHIVSLWVDTGIGQQVSEAQFGPRLRGRYAQALEPIHIAALDIEIGAHRQEPIRVL